MRAPRYLDLSLSSQDAISQNNRFKISSHSIVFSYIATVTKVFKSCQDPMVDLSELTYDYLPIDSCRGAQPRRDTYSVGGVLATAPRAGWPQQTQTHAAQHNTQADAQTQALRASLTHRRTHPGAAPPRPRPTAGDRSVTGRSPATTTDHTAHTVHYFPTKKSGLFLSRVG